jgi:acetyltransferase
MSANGLQQHALRPLLLPRGVALVGASERPGSLGRIVFENALQAAFAGDLYAVNPRHREVLGRKSWPKISAIGLPVDLAVIAAPAQAIRDVLDDAATTRVDAAILLTDPPAGDTAQQRKWTRDIAQFAARRGIRLVGPGAFGLVRTDISLNASITDVPALRGRLALVAQSGAVCTAMLDFAAPLHIGFSTVLSLGAGVDINFGEMLDCLLLDEETDSILLYVESVREARRFVSALRAAARTKPVVVLKAGRSREAASLGNAPSEDAVFEAAVRRAGTVRVRTYTQLFAAARILALGRIPRGDRIAIVANGRGPALLAADTATDRDVRLAPLDPATVLALDKLLPAECDRSNPVDVRADAPPERLAGAVAALLADANVDAAVVLHVPRPSIGSTDSARAVAAIARDASKPVLAAWLGAIDRPEAREALEAGGVANFYTPENAVDAFSFLAAYRRHQELLLEVPPPQQEPEPPDLAAADSVRREAESEGRTTLSDEQSSQLLAAFGLHAMPVAAAADADEAKRLARQFGYPVSLELYAKGSASRSPSLRREKLRDARAVSRAYAHLIEASQTTPRRNKSLAIVLRKEADGQGGPELSLGVYTDPTFGPVVAFGASVRSPLARSDRALMLPPLNRRLAVELLNGVQGLPRAGFSLGDEANEALLRVMLQVSALVCALPWVVELELDPLTPTAGQPAIGCVRIAVDFKRARLANYAHMAIHPYPSELVSEVRARNGAIVVIRPIRPEDAALERRFVSSLSDETRYLRFFYRMHELTPAMLARFTQVDYDRELALVAVVEDLQAAESVSFAGVARYIENPDRTSAEYAIVVHDAWQRHGIGRALMEKLIAAARRRGLVRLEGAVLRENARMREFVESFGFTTSEDPDDPEQVLTALDLGQARVADVA